MVLGPSLSFIALREQTADFLDSCTAEGVPEEFYLLVFLRLAQVFQHTGIFFAVPVVVVAFAVDLAKVYLATEQICPQDAGSVPCGVVRPK